MKAEQKGQFLMTLLSAPLEFSGDWGNSPPDEAALVISRTRDVCLFQVGLFSDRQPDTLRVVSRLSGPPHVWLADPASACVIIDGSNRDWCRMAYQFGHELGHVLCNSWQIDALPMKPTQWLEESLVEAFSLRGIALLADSWEQDTPLADDKDYAKYLRRYREALITPYRKGGRPASSALNAWFAANRTALENGIGGRPGTGPVMLMILGEIARDKACVQDLGAVNRWPARTAIQLEEYLRLWEESCIELGTSGRLPLRLRQLLFADEAPEPPRRPPQPYVRRPHRGEVREQVVAIDDLVPWDHPVRTVWAFVEALDLREIQEESLAKKRPQATRGPPPVVPQLLTALWLWATAEGIGSAWHIERLCRERLSYRWLCGGVAIDHETLDKFRRTHPVVLDRILSHGLAALIEEDVLSIDLLGPETVKAKGLAGTSSVRRRAKTKALAAAAAVRVDQLRSELDKNDPIADERHRRAMQKRAVNVQRSSVAAALAQNPGRLKKENLSIPQKRIISHSI